MSKQKYIPVNKRSKAEQKAYYAQMRKDWGNVNPITKVVRDNHKAKRDNEYAKACGY